MKTSATWPWLWTQLSRLGRMYGESGRLGSGPNGRVIPSVTLMEATLPYLKARSKASHNS